MGGIFMWDFLSKIVESVPSWFLMALIVFILAAAVYFLPKLRRDKNGKWYIFSRSYEHNKNHQKEIRARLKDISLDILKLSVFTSELPLSERMASGIKFMNNGGNGDARKYITAELRPQNEEMYDTLDKFIEK
jgi:hypothetical protein